MMHPRGKNIFVVIDEPDHVTEDRKGNPSRAFHAKVVSVGGSVPVEVSDGDHVLISVYGAYDCVMLRGKHYVLSLDYRDIIGTVEGE